MQEHLVKRFVPSDYYPGGQWLVLRELKVTGIGVVYDTVDTFAAEYEIEQRYGDLPNG